MDNHFILLVIVQVLCVFIFLSIFFFTYASKIEGKIVENQVKFVIDDIAQHNLHLLSTDKKILISSAVTGIDSNSPKNLEAAQTIVNSNNILKIKTKKILISLTIIVTIIVLILNKNANLKSIFKETGIIIIFIALTEYIFLNYFAAEYISVKPNILKAQIFKNISQGFSTPI